MLKRVVIFFIAFIVVNAAGFAQEIDKETYKKLEDYVRCKYVEFYLDEYYKNISNNNATFYKDTTKPQLSNCTIENSISNEELIQRISLTPAKSLVQGFNNKDNSTIDLLFSWNSYGTQPKVDFTKLNSKLRGDITKYLESKTIQGSTDNPSIDRTEANRDTKTENKVSETLNVTVDKKSVSETSKVINNSFWGIPLKLLIVVVLVAIIFKFRKPLFNFIRQAIPFLDRLKSKDKDVTENNFDELKELKEERDRLKEENERLRRKKNELIGTNNDFVKENRDLKRKLEYYESDKQNIEQKAETTTIDVFEELESPSILYADAISNGFFNKVTETPDEDTIFELLIQNTQQAQDALFVIYSDAERRIVKCPEFLDGCETQVINNTQNVTIGGNGVAQKQADGRWKIVKKLNVIIN